MELRSGPGVSREGSRPAVVVRAEPLVSVGLNQHEVMVLAPRLPPHPSLHGAPGSPGPVRRALPLQNDNQWVAMFLKDKSSRTLSFGVAGYFGNEGKSCVLYGSDLCVSGENERAVMGKGEGKESREGRKKDVRRSEQKQRLCTAGYGEGTAERQTPGRRLLPEQRGPMSSCNLLH